ncbi:hypothetical protein [Streptomyces clavuligerus]|uniref:Uncharacterized protein n=1 Tax=Streptomyces clavuligerus TaxID=1901 RepID=E2Q0J7_STRCL|nr:hypothetical protein [Streptomyces clavuligerus]ANW16935.1 hypothetical protein BB341_01170 [Streptomyces clavuligerus]AXU11464.1 hypothetical protein D1794_01245 [Streptomyces clavuligerus]EFG10540.1 Hypothetical protein SCLAV_5473 [Streptomyces clavuligerus]MBY6301282.1 hypothetical protein [Streptomyces clavuligerus]QCS04336.1 hypothetical protein CRV15_01245 [Streptomyces clavuligerus]
MNASDMSSVPVAQDPEWTGIRTLGHANRFATWDSEFRYDGRIRVPMGVKIKAIRYSYYGNGQATMDTVECKRGQSGIDQQYEVIDLAFLDDSDLITFTLRGDLNVDADPRPAYSRTYRILVEAVLDDGTVRSASPEVEVLAGAWTQADPQMVGRPFVRLPWDNNWGGSPNSQAGFGYVSDNGLIPGDKFIVDLVNLRQGVQGVASNHSDHVYYQLVREDGTPSRATPAPQKLSVPGHQDSGTGRKVTLPPLNLRQLGDRTGYYRFLVWPGSTTEPGGTASALGWDPAKPEDAFQIGSVYYRYHAGQDGGTGQSAYIWAEDRTAVAGQTKWVYPAFVVSNTGQSTIGTVPIVFTAPEGLHFLEESVTFTRWSAPDTEIKAAGSLSADRRTLTCPAVPLNLATGKDPWVSVYPAVGVEQTATGSLQVGIAIGEPAFATAHATIVVTPAG